MNELVEKKTGVVRLGNGVVLHVMQLLILMILLTQS